MQKTSTNQVQNEERAETIFQPDDVKDSTENNSEPTVYETVLPVILEKLQSPSTVDELSQALDVVKPQLNAWLKKALDEKKVVKLSRPVRYQRFRSEERL